MAKDFYEERSVADRGVAEGCVQARRSFSEKENRCRQVFQMAVARFGGFWHCLRRWQVIMMFVVGFCLMPNVQAQESLPQFIVNIIEEQAAEGASAEELVLHYEGLMSRPLNLNAVSRRSLEESGLLTVFQVESLLAWRERYGSIRSMTELGLVEGFDAEFVSELKPFVRIGEVENLPETSNTFTLKGRKKWKQDGMSLTAKESFESARLSFGAVLDNDPKERFPDFVSLSARYKGLYAGDFTARFGQGLVLWKAFSMSSFGTPSSAARRGNGIQSYRSTDEANFFRGAACSHSFGRVAVAVFCSRNALDARVVDSTYTSIVTGGIHVSESELAKRRSMHELVLGGNVSLESGRWHFGVTGLAYSYDKHNGRKVQDYNRFQQYDGWWGNLGIDFYGSIGSLRLFGEAAVDVHMAPAVIAGALWSPSYNFETSLMLRCYSPSYIATHAGAYSTLGSVSNQIGALWSARIVKGQWTMQSDMEYVHYPWKRYRAEAGTGQFRCRLQVSRSFRSGGMLQGQLSLKDELKARLHVELPLGGKLQLSSRIEGGKGGLACYAGMGWKPSRHWEVSGRLTYFNTDGWDSRIYFYERNVPQSFAVEPYYGKGIGEYLVVKYSPNKNLDFWLKIQQGYVSYFVRIFIPGRRTLLALSPLSL